ncbi:MAG: hypothetical protein AABX03_04500, partial [Nanoarchaeota archaeon]
LTALAKYVNSDYFTKDADLLREKDSKEYLDITLRLNEELKKMSNDPKYLEKIRNGKLSGDLYSAAMDNMKLALKKLKSKSIVYHDIEKTRVELMKKNPSHFFPEDLYKHGLMPKDEFTRYKMEKARTEKIQAKKKRNKIIAAVASASIVGLSLFTGAFYKYLDRHPDFRERISFYEQRSVSNYNFYKFK